MPRLTILFVAITLLATSALAGPGAAQALSVTTSTLQTPTDATVNLHSAKREHTYPRPACRLAADAGATPDTAGQYVIRRNPEGTSVSMTLSRTLWTSSLVTPLAHQLSHLDDDIIPEDAVDITLLLANNDVIELADVGLEVDVSQGGQASARTHVRLPRQAVDALAASPVVQLTWVVDGVRYPTSLSRHQGQRYYQQPFACMAATLP